MFQAFCDEDRDFPKDRERNDFRSATTDGKMSADTAARYPLLLDLAQSKNRASNVLARFVTSLSFGYQCDEG